MQRVGFDGFAVVFARYMPQRLCTCDVYGQSHQQYQYGDDAGLNMYVMKKQSVDALVNDEDRGDEQQRGLDEG